MASLKERFRAHQREFWGLSIAALLIAGVVAWFIRDQASMRDAEHAAKIIAILIGGLWVIFQFILRQAFESTLSMKTRVRSEAIGNDYRVFVEIVLANTGGRRIVAARSLSSDELRLYEDSITYPCDLEIRRVGAHTGETEAEAYSYENWWESKTWIVPETGRQHVSVLAEYSLDDGTIDFFMEPGEKYSLGHLFTMRPGHYMAKVVFVGARAGAAEYWSRTTFFRVPKRPPKASGDEQSKNQQDRVRRTDNE